MNAVIAVLLGGALVMAVVMFGPDAYRYWQHKRRKRFEHVAFPRDDGLPKAIDESASSGAEHRDEIREELLDEPTDKPPSGRDRYARLDKRRRSRGDSD